MALVTCQRIMRPPRRQQPPRHRNRLQMGALGLAYSPQHHCPTRLDHRQQHHDVLIAYRNQAGNRTVRALFARMA
jgi:hypothetical protein